MLSDAVGGGRVSNFHEKILTKMWGSTLLLALRGGGWVPNFEKKALYVTLEWPLAYHIKFKL